MLSIFPGMFTGAIANRQNIGKTSQELALQWNRDYPDDQILVSVN